jgi:hypothetical protein
MEVVCPMIEAEVEDDMVTAASEPAGQANSRVRLSCALPAEAVRTSRTQAREAELGMRAGGIGGGQSSG